MTIPHLEVVVVEAPVLAVFEEVRQLVAVLQRSVELARRGQTLPVLDLLGVRLAHRRARVRVEPPILVA